MILKVLINFKADKYYVKGDVIKDIRMLLTNVTLKYLLDNGLVEILEKKKR